MSRKQATIGDVAEAAGVSAATVSRALRGFPNVAPSTRQRIEEVAQRLHYRVDPAASRLASGRSSTVAVVVPVLDSWYFSTVMAGAEVVLSDKGYELAMFVTGDEVGRERLMASSMLRGADGVVLVDVALDEAQVATLVKHSGPIVTVGLEYEGVPSVVVDDVRIGRLAVEHLLSLGHTAIGLISGSNHARHGFAVPHSRSQGYRSGLESASIEIRPEFDVDGNFSVEGGYEAMCQLLALDDGPTAIFAMSDEMAFGAIKAIRDHGMTVPDDISIVGVDDHPMAWVEGLTTFEQNVGNHGTFAAQCVLNLIEGEPQEHDRIEARASLVIRESTIRLV